MIISSSVIESFQKVPMWQHKIGLHLKNKLNTGTNVNLAGTQPQLIETIPYNDIIPFLSEHIQPADQILLLGANSDLAIQLSKEGYGTINTGFLIGIISI
jgi:hypothetical protein